MLVTPLDEGSGRGFALNAPCRKVALVIIEVLDGKNWSKVTTAGLAFHIGIGHRRGAMAQNTNEKSKAWCLSSSRGLRNSASVVQYDADQRAVNVHAPAVVVNEA